MHVPSVELGEVGHQEGRRVALAAGEVVHPRDELAVGELTERHENVLGHGPVNTWDGQGRSDPAGRLARLRARAHDLDRGQAEPAREEVGGESHGPDGGGHPGPVQRYGEAAQAGRGPQGGHSSRGAHHVVHGEDVAVGTAVREAEEAHVQDDRRDGKEPSGQGAPLRRWGPAEAASRAGNRRACQAVQEQRDGPIQGNGNQTTRPEVPDEVTGLCEKTGLVAAAATPSWRDR